MKELACRKCKTLTNGKVCPNCKSKNLSSDWSGLVVVMDVNTSLIAKTLKVDRPGRYALKVR